MPHVRVFVTLKPALLDAQGRVVQESLHSLGYKQVEQVRIGKVLDLQIASSENLPQQVEEMCKRFLANTVIEDFCYEVLS